MPAPQPAVRVMERLADGSEADQLRSADGRVCIQLVRTLQKALMGKVKLGILCSREAAGEPWVASKAPSARVAVKQLSKRCMERGETTEGRRVRENPRVEIAVLSLLSSPGHAHVLRMLHFFEDADCVYLVLEFCAGGELFEQIERHKRVPEQRARGYLWGMLQATHYLHGRGLCHRDISLENAMLGSVLLPAVDAGGGGAAAAPAAAAAGAAATAAAGAGPPDEALVVKLIDFGLTKQLPPAGALMLPDGQVGKPKYMAPETYALRPYDGRAIDAWTLGISAFILIFGVYPYTTPSAELCKYFAAISRGGLPDLISGWGLAPLASAPAIDCLRRLLAVDPRARLTVEAALAHPWFEAERRAQLQAGGSSSSGT